MLIIVEKDSAQSNDSAKNGTRKRSDTLPSARYFNIHVHIWSRLFETVPEGGGYEIFFVSRAPFEHASLDSSDQGLIF